MAETAIAVHYADAGIAEVAHKAFSRAGLVLRGAKVVWPPETTERGLDEELDEEFEGWPEEDDGSYSDTSEGTLVTNGCLRILRHKE